MYICDIYHIYKRPYQDAVLISSEQKPLIATSFNQFDFYVIEKKLQNYTCTYYNITIFIKIKRASYFGRVSIAIKFLIGFF